MNKKFKLYLKATFEIIVSLILGILVWDLGLLTFAGYFIAFIGALRKKLFFKRRKMAKKLFFGTILVYLGGLLIPFVLNNLVSGDLIGGSLMILLAGYFWISGRELRRGKSRV